MAEGNAFEAMRQYGFFQPLLREQLGMDASDRMQQPASEIRYPAADRDDVRGPARLASVS